jgi:hypothetical protein
VHSPSINKQQAEQYANVFIHNLAAFPFFLNQTFTKSQLNFSAASNSSAKSMQNFTFAISYFILNFLGTFFT